MARIKSAIVVAAAVALATASSTAMAACDGPDPAVVGLDLQNIQKTHRGTYDFEVMCVVRNNGTADYSDGNKAGITLVEFERGDPEGEGKRLRFHRLRTLEKGDTLLTGRWILDWPPEAQNPPSYECRIVYDTEDSGGDSSELDCDTSNNWSFVSGQDVRNLLDKPAVQTLPPLTNPN
ncbi:MAG: hypothetical protein KDJ16_05920 [Hyphomicrobiales bacterium]|nr:hypothetical protein [Hyphomicrobiales bacterium]